MIRRFRPDVESIMLTFWISAYAGMALVSSKGVQRGEAHLPRVWGCPPILFFFSPKIEDPPQEEWGPGG